MLISITESSSTNFFIGEPYLILRNGEWEKASIIKEYISNTNNDKFSCFEIAQNKGTELKTSLYCVQTKIKKESTISNDKGFLTVIPDTFWDKNKLKYAKEKGFFIETNGKTLPKLNPNKKHISVCYTGRDNKTYIFTIFAQLQDSKISAAFREAKQLKEKLIKKNQKNNFGK